MMKGANISLDLFWNASDEEWRALYEILKDLEREGVLMVKGMSWNFDNYMEYR